MSILLKVIWYILFIPGYAVIWTSYFWPTEAGKKRNVATSARHWRHQHLIAPLITIAIYSLILLSVFGDQA